MSRPILSALILAALASAAPLTPAPAQEGMSASARLAMPGARHAWLDPLVGDWDVEMLVYPAPGAAALVDDALTATRRWTLDGRYLREELRGSFLGTPSARDATTGYNALDGRFELVTVDTFEPGQMVYLGRGDEAEARFSMYGVSTEAGAGPEPTGRKRDLRFEIEVRDADYNVQRIFAKYPGGEEFLFVEQRFTRR